MEGSSRFYFLTAPIHIIMLCIARFIRHINFTLQPFLAFDPIICNPELKFQPFLLSITDQFINDFVA